MSVRRFGVSLEDELLESLDTYVRENSFTNRSQAIRFLIEKSLAEKKWQCNHIVAGTICIIYEKGKSEIASQISEIENASPSLILSSCNYYLNPDTVMHVTTVTGQARDLTALADRLITIKEIKHGKLLMSRAD